MPRQQDHATTIASLNHPHVRHLQRLQSRAERDRRGLFFVDGPRFLAAALAGQAAIELVVAAPRLFDTPFSQHLLAAQRQAGRPCLIVTPEVYSRIATAETPRGLGAVIRQRWQPLDGMTGREGLCWTVLETVQSPGNLGTILRTSEAVGGAGLILLGETADPYHPAVVRASMGAIFSQRLVRTSLPALRSWKTRHGIPFVGASAAAAHEYRMAAYRPPLALVMGWERRGLSDNQRSLCDLTVRLPMVGQIDSLNVAVATGVLLYDLLARATTSNER